jgi:hypothetical protein
MGILLAFAPFFVFVVVESTISVTTGLTAAALIAAILFIKDVFSRKEIKVLDVGTLLLFGSRLVDHRRAPARRHRIAAHRARIHRDPQALHAAYAREQVAQEFWSSPEFLRINNVITAAWAAAFSVMVATEAALLYVPAMPQRIGIWITVLAILAAIKFTSWYPERNKAKSA